MLTAEQCDLEDIEEMRRQPDQSVGTLGSRAAGAIKKKVFPKVGFGAAISDPMAQEGALLVIHAGRACFVRCFAGGYSAQDLAGLNVNCQA